MGEGVVMEVVVGHAVGVVPEDDFVFLSRDYFWKMMGA